MTTITAAEFLQVFRTRREYCLALRELSQQQSACISADDYSRLLELLEHKQRLLARMDELARRDAGVWDAWGMQRDRLTAANRRACEFILEEIESILSELVRCENDSAEFLTARRDETQQRLKSVSQAGRVHQAYHDTQTAATHRRLNLNR